MVGVSTVVREAVLARYPFPYGWGVLRRPRRTTVKVGPVFPIEEKVHREDIPLEVRKRASVVGGGGPFQRDSEKAQQGYFYPVKEELWNWFFENIPEIAAWANAEGVAFRRLVGAIDTDARVQALARKEQARLRKALLDGAEEAECGICGRTFPERYLHAAHIKKRADASDAERIDPDIAMLACLLGCDKAFECGDILVTEGGIIRLRDSEDVFLKEAFGYLEGTTAPAYHEGTAQYFADRTASFVEVLKD